MTLPRTVAALIGTNPRVIADEVANSGGKAGTKPVCRLRDGLTRQGGFSCSAVPVDPSPTAPAFAADGKRRRGGK